MMKDCFLEMKEWKKTQRVELSQTIDYQLQTIQDSKTLIIVDLRNEEHKENNRNVNCILKVQREPRQHILAARGIDV